MALREGNVLALSDVPVAATGAAIAATEQLMTSTDTVFAGSIPAIYDQYMVPLLFQPYADLVAERAKSLPPKRILETAAGTGVVTAALQAALPDADIIATDLNQAMLDVAKGRIGSGQVSFQQADAQQLPFKDMSFDLVVCQFGIMFVPDKVKANAEARRVLRQGGRYILVIWDNIERNAATRAVGEAVANLFPDNAESFFERIPFRYHDPAAIERDLRAAGFTKIDLQTVEIKSRLPSARHAAIALCQGNPMRTEIEKQGPAELDRATDAAAKALARFEGVDGFDAPMSAHIVTAIR